MLLRSEVELQMSDSRQEGNIKSQDHTAQIREASQNPSIFENRGAAEVGKKKLVVSAHLKSPLLFRTSHFI